MYYEYYMKASMESHPCEVVCSHCAPLSLSLSTVNTLHNATGGSDSNCVARYKGDEEWKCVFAPVRAAAALPACVFECFHVFFLCMCVLDVFHVCVFSVCVCVCPRCFHMCVLYMCVFSLSVHLQVYQESTLCPQLSLRHGSAGWYTRTRLPPSSLRPGPDEIFRQLQKCVLFCHWLLLR